MINENISKEKYVESLKWRLQILMDEIADLQRDLQEKYQAISDKQEQSRKLLSLLSFEKIELDNIDFKLVGEISISDIAYDYLDKDELCEPVHYIELTNKLLSKGNYIPGKNPSANLLSQINKDNRFVRVSSGTYGLKKWNLIIPDKIQRNRTKKGRSRNNNKK